MAENLIFNSLEKRIPEIRRDIQIIPVRDNGRKLLYFHDSMGYIPPHFALDVSVEPLLNMFSGVYSIEEVTKFLNHKIKPIELLGFTQLLDENLVINSRYFHQQSEKINDNFEKANTRKPVLSGPSYSNQPDYLNKFLQQISSADTYRKNGKKLPQALYAPHIDINIGYKQYSEAFIQIRNLKPKRVIILGTAHYTGYFGSFYDNTPFIGSDKVFELPGNQLNPDSEVLQQMMKGSQTNGFTLNDRAHRMEHSIEIHLLLVREIWKHDFKIVPILVGGFDELFYKSDGDLGTKIDRFAADLREWIDDETFILVSGDLSHVGRKFGDADSANSMKSWVKKMDMKFLEYAAMGKTNDLLSILTETFDQTRICGFPPLYLFLKLLQPPDGRIINYHWWDESERESAVSFGSVIY